MIEFFKNLFASKVAKREYDLIEKMHLRRLEQDEEYYEHKGKEFYALIQNEVYLVKILGAYRYFDVDGTVAGLVAEKKSNGEVLNVGYNGRNLFKRKPHDWISYLKDEYIYEYQQSQRYNSDSELESKFFNKLPINIIREIKLKRLKINI